MRRFSGATQVKERGYISRRLAIVVTLAAVVLAFLLAPTIHAAPAARAGQLANGAPAAGMAQSLFAAAVPATEEMVVSFALALSVGVLLLAAAELLWRLSRRPDSRH